MGWGCIAARVVLPLRLAARDYLDAVLETVESAGRQTHPRIHSLHRGVLVVAGERRNRLHADGVIGLEDIYKRGGAVMLYGRGRHQRHFSQRPHQQARIYKLIWKQRKILVLKRGPKLYCSRCRIDLIV